MKATVLASKMKKLPAYYLKDGERGLADSARTAFLMNLCGQLKIAVELDHEQGLLVSLVEAVSKYKKEIPKPKIEAAHKEMVFPWARSIISACLYPNNSVSGFGIPLSYSA
jgi:hypothetical protein